jgi:hypothetical protein
MSVARDIAEARALLERAERESDPEQESHHIEAALAVLETVDDATPEENRLISNLRTSYARRLLTRLPRLESVPFDVWLFYYGVLVQLAREIKTLTAADSALDERRKQFLSVWGPQILAELEKKAKAD